MQQTTVNSKKLHARVHQGDSGNPELNQPKPTLLWDRSNKHIEDLLQPIRDDRPLRSGSQQPIGGRSVHASANQESESAGRGAGSRMGTGGQSGTVLRGDRLAVGWRDVTTAAASTGIGRDKRSLPSLPDRGGNEQPWSLFRTR